MSEQRFEPEVLALLDEIARSPDATLLRIPRERLLRFVGRPEEMISPRGSWLTKAEKHLVTAYREQAARVLLEACVLQLKEDPQFFSSLTTNAKALGKKARRILPCLSKEDGAAVPLRDLIRDKRVIASSLAIASLRLSPSECARNTLAIAYQNEGHIQASMRVLTDMLNGNPSRVQKAQALSNLGRAHELRGGFSRAYTFNRQASITDKLKSRFLVWSVASALQAGDETGALDSSRHIDSDTPHGDLEQAIHGLRLGRTRGSWRPTAAATRLAARIQRQQAGKSGAIFEAFS